VCSVLFFLSLSLSGKRLSRKNENDFLSESRKRKERKTEKKTPDLTLDNFDVKLSKRSGKAENRSSIPDEAAYMTMRSILLRLSVAGVVWWLFEAFKIHLKLKVRPLFPSSSSPSFHMPCPGHHYYSKKYINSLSVPRSLSPQNQARDKAIEAYACGKANHRLPPERKLSIIEDDAFDASLEELEAKMASAGRPELGLLGMAPEANQHIVRESVAFLGGGAAALLQVQTENMYVPIAHHRGCRNRPFDAKTVSPLPLPCRKHYGIVLFLTLKAFSVFVCCRYRYSWHIQRLRTR
jgi:hypothetical protein